MSEKMLFRLIPLVTLLAIVLSGCGALKEFSVTGAKDAENMAQEIADFDLPAGFNAQYGATLNGISLAAYANENPTTHLFLAQASPGSDLTSADLQQAIAERQEKGKEKDRGSRMKVVSREDRTVRGKPAVLLISEGTNSSDQPYRDANLLFEGKSGPALASIAAPISAWDDAAAQAFFTSIR